MSSDLERDWLVCGPVSERVLNALPKRRKVHEIVLEVASETGVPTQDILGPCRAANIVSARRQAMARARIQGYSYLYIGRYMNRDHTTVLHACKKMGVA